MFLKQELELIAEVNKKYYIPANKFIIGGQSLAVHQTILYAEKTYNPN